MIKVEESQRTSLLQCLPSPFQTASEECGSLRAQLEAQGQQLQMTKEAVQELEVSLAGVLSRKGTWSAFAALLKAVFPSAASCQTKAVIGSDNITTQVYAITPFHSLDSGLKGNCS